MDYARVEIIKSTIKASKEAIDSHNKFIKLLEAELSSICTHPQGTELFFTEVHAGFIINFRACSICGLTKQITEI